MSDRAREKCPECFSKSKHARGVVDNAEGDMTCNVKNCQNAWHEAGAAPSLDTPLSTTPEVNGLNDIGHKDDDLRATTKADAARIGEIESKFSTKCIHDVSIYDCNDCLRAMSREYFEAWESVLAEVERLRIQEQCLREAGRQAESELAIAKKIIAWANNSLYGSHGFFLSLDGGEPNEHHLDSQIEIIKASANKACNKLTTVQEEAERLRGERDALAGRVLDREREIERLQRVESDLIVRAEKGEKLADENWRLLETARDRA